MREYELNYLRGELNQRVNFNCEHTHKVFKHITLLWGGTLALFSAMGNWGNMFMLFIIVTIFFISVIVLYFLSRMDFESIKTISEIAAYITIFYEERPNIEKDGKFFWELSRFEMRKTKKLNWKYNNKFNGEYFWFSIIAIAIKILLLIIFCDKNCGILNTHISDIVMFVICILYVVFSIFLLFRIFKNSSSASKWHNLIKSYMKFFLDYAIETKYYTKEEAKERLGEYIYGEITK